ncbi:serine/threonine-protein phosphatase 6 regulatory ankyrin repeat subunit B-like isoform X2 [Montipora capricornis]
MFQAINDGDVSALQEILKEQNSNLNSSRTGEGDLALHLAVHARNIEVVKLLVENGATINTQNNENKTALHIAIANQDIALVDYLTSRRAKFDIPDNDGITAEQLASNMEAADIIEKLQVAKEERQQRPIPLNAVALLLEAVNNESIEDLKELMDFEILDDDVHQTCKEENGDSPLHIAARKGNVEICRLLVQSGAKTDAKNADGNTILHIAAELGDVAMARFLYSAKAKPNIVNNDGDTPLHLACQRKHVSIVDLLLAKFSANIGIPNKKSDTPLFIAVRVNCPQAIKQLLNSAQADQDVKAGRSASGDTLLHLAVDNKDIEVVKSLVQAGAPPDEQNNVGKTPLHIAAIKGDEEMVKFLHTAKANPNILDNEEMTPLHYAAHGGHQAVILYFLEKFKVDASARNRDGSTLLHMTCQAGNLEASTALIKRGVLVHMPNKSGGLSIHDAARKGHVGLLKLLLEKGVPVNIKNKNKYTPLHIAALNRKHLAAQLLVGFGADVSVVGGVSKETPLHMAAKVKGGEKVVDVLIKSGADPDTAKEDGERALHLAARCGNLDVVKLLLREDTEVARRSGSGETPIHLACRNGHYEIARVLVDKVFQVKSRPLARLIINIPNTAGETAFHSVAAISPGTKSNPRDIVSIVQMLLERGADLTLSTYNKRETPLHLCSRSGNHEIVEEIFASEKVPEHVKLAIINKTTERGASSLMIASQNGMLEVVQELLRFHARVDVFDEVGGTALHYAASTGHVEVARELLNHKAYVNGKTKPNVRNFAGKTRRDKEDDDDDMLIGQTPLHIAADKGHADFVRVLVTQYKAMVDPLRADKKTPLHLASESGRRDVCKVLLDLRADASVADNKNMIPAHYAALKDHDDIVELFYSVKPDTMTQVNAEGLNAFQIASQTGSIKVVRQLVELDFAKCSSDKGVLCKPLLLAARGGHKEIVEYLLESGASPTEEDQEGMSVLHLAAKFGQLKVIDMLWGKTPIDRTSVKNGMTAIHVAALFGQTEVVQEFLSRAPKSALFVSEKPGDGNEGEEDFGFTPLHLASQNGDNTLVRVITNHPGVRVDSVTVKTGRTALHVASLRGHIEVASTLISKASTLLHQVDNDGRTALHLAAVNGHRDLLTILIGQGADIDAQDNLGNTALHIAAEAGYPRVVKLLMEYGASSMIENKSEDVALCNAARERHTEVMDFLLTQKVNHERLLNNRKFLVDIVLCSRAHNYKSLMNFVLGAPAPVHISSFLSRHYRIESTHNKEHWAELTMASEFCESMAKDLISISCAEDSEAVLNSIDGKKVAFLDFLIDCGLKQCVSHSLVQQYVSQIWFGDLKMEDWKLILLAVVSFFFPPLWVYLSLPFKNRHRQIPVIKFICRLISHLYLIFILSLTVVVPWNYSGTYLAPHWYEYFLYLWIIGMLLAEFSSERVRSGLGWFPTIVVLLIVFSELLRVIAVGYESPQRIGIVFARDQFLGAAVMLSVLQLLDFLSIHRLFGPWSVIIGHLVVDVLRFLLILLIFFASFTLQLLAVLKPIGKENENSYTIVQTDPDFMKVVELLFFGLFGLTSTKDLSENNKEYAKSMIKVVFGLYNVLIIIVLINLLIAMMSDTYQRLQEQSDVEWKFGRARLIRNMERETANPVPINVFSKLIDFLKRLYRANCRCRKTGITSELSAENGSIAESQGRRLNTRRTAGLGEAFEQEWDLIYSVVDWQVIVEKYLDSKGEGQPKIKKKGGRGMNNGERKENVLAQGQQSQNNHEERVIFSDVADSTVMKINVLNSLKV